MGFDSLEFIFFAILFFTLWPLARKNKTVRFTYITVFSLFFYAWGEPRYLPLLVANGVVDFFIAKQMANHPQAKKTWLYISIAFNVGVLAFFKYLDWFIANTNFLMKLVGIDFEIPYLRLILPLGISFYTFCSMSYTIDVYRGRIKPTNNLLHFMSLIALFPHLVAGPIVRAGHMLPQLEDWHKVTPTRFWNGLRLIVYGFFKKLVIADQVANAVDTAFRAQELNPSSTFWWLIMAFFFVQIYCDFSGYSDIARGLAKWMGYDFPLNFSHPMWAPSSTKVWLRWHMSLFSWLRDYVFYPLAGKRPNRLRINLAMSLTMIISGIWHGAAWTFFFWGVLNAAYMWIERDTKWPDRLLRVRGGYFIAAWIVMWMMTQSTLYFRAHDLNQAFAIHATMLSFNFDDTVLLLKKYPFEILATLFVFGRNAWFHMKHPRFDRWRKHTRYWTEPLELAILITVAVFLRGPGNAFIYFNF